MRSLTKSETSIISGGNILFMPLVIIAIPTMPTGDSKETKSEN